MTIQSLDHSATLFLNFDGGVLLDRFMWFASEKFTWLPLYLLLLWFVARKWGWRYMLVVFLAVVLGVGLSDQICNFFKETFQMLRPNRVEGVKEYLHYVLNPLKGELCIYGRYGTISAHSATTISIFTIVGLGALRSSKCYWRWMPLWVMLVGYSRIYLGVHFLSQVLLGWILGALVGYVIVWFMGRIPWIQRLKRAK